MALSADDVQATGGEHGVVTLLPSAARRLADSLVRLGRQGVELGFEVSAEDAKVAETAGGYAKEMSEDYKRKQAQVLRDHLKKQDVVVTTALIPGKPAPRLIDASMVAEMKPGAVIVDLAVESGGNCELSEFGKIVVKHGVTIVGHPNVPSRIAVDASALYARNVLTFLTPLLDKETKALKIDLNDEVVKGMLLTREGAVVHPALAGGGT